MDFYLGVDGGGTKTKFAICDSNGKIRGEYTSGSCHYLQVGFDGVTKLMNDGLNKVSLAAGLNPGEIKHAFLGLAGYGDIASHALKIEKAVSKSLGSLTFNLGNDCENALAGALCGNPGINVIAGTGSVGYGRDAYGNSYRCGGWHYALGGDEGSAYWLGWTLLKTFSRQSDGRNPKTDLHEAVKDFLQVKTDDEVVNKVAVEWLLDRGKIAALSPLCGELCEKGDPAAIQIIKNCAWELADYAKAICSHLKFNDNISVSGTGGVFSIGKTLTDEFDALLKQKGMHYVPAAHEPVLGAVLLAAKNDGVTLTF